MITAPGTKMVDTMELIDTIERLGVSYHFQDEIEHKLQLFFDLKTDYCNDDDDAYIRRSFIKSRDDTYDAYGTIEELDIFTEAIERWNVEETKRFPEYMKPLYKALLELYKQFEQELEKEGRSYVAYYAIESVRV
ncbi:hypothetical protein C2S53_011793 [Perilla frutescens var. hirtella]|uniref:Terpene synthase metal-binding domain-containing protein n=1 Tax=Perilla frutescens var. hirtella TaxID=608512 RepID=A0AAD4IZH7_PERFH|nr:hypothetical protein C2S53_011793 [Perilla frutescens var. hirtella]